MRGVLRLGRRDRAPRFGQAQGRDELTNQWLIAEGLIAHERARGNLVNRQLSGNTFDECSLPNDHSHAVPPHAVAHVRLAQGSRHSSELGGALGLFNHHDGTSSQARAGHRLALRSPLGGTDACFDAGHRIADGGTVAMHVGQDNRLGRAAYDSIEAPQDAGNSSTKTRGCLVGVAKHHERDTPPGGRREQSDGAGREFLRIVDDNDFHSTQGNTLGHGYGGLPHHFGGIGKAVAHGVKDIGERGSPKTRGSLPLGYAMLLREFF